MADSSKTEQPTQRRVQKARSEGQFLSAREFVSALQFLVLLSLLGAGGARWFAQFRGTTRYLFALAFRGDISPPFVMDRLAGFLDTPATVALGGCGCGRSYRGYPFGYDPLRFQLKKSLRPI